MSERAIRRHPTDYMRRLQELAGTPEPVAVVIRPDGSLDVYGNVGIVDQQSANERPYTWIVGHNRYLHEHRYQGQTLRHSHPDGERDHGYYEHPEDIRSGSQPEQGDAPSYADLLAFARDVAQCGPDMDDDRCHDSDHRETLEELAATAEAMLNGGPYNGSYDGA